MTGNLAPAMTAVLLLITASPASAQTRQRLFDGKSLAGWHVQGEGLWSVEDGEIQALNPKRDWAHLITDQVFKDGYVRLRFRIRSGNSGLFVRASEGGVYKVQGMQVDFGPIFESGGWRSYDGSVMRVTATDYAWFEKVGKAMDSGWTVGGAWNELAVDMQGGGLRTYVNGHLVWQQAAVPGMAASGAFALQLHSGDANDISFKDIEILLPTRIPHCPDPADPAYMAGNDPDTRLCRNPVSVITPARESAAEARAKARTGRAASGFDRIPGFHFPLHPGARRFDLRGARRGVPAPTSILIH